MASERTARLNAARKEPGDHAGPHGSEPITDAKSVKSAMKLAGRVKGGDPAEIRANVKRIAERKGLGSALPKTPSYEKPRKWT